MALRSTLSTICFRFVIAFFVQERIFVCGYECFCDCNKRYVCDELQRLSTSDDVNRGQWRKWNTYFKFLETLHLNFDPEVWTERLSSIENQIGSREDLKGKLKETESHVTRLEDALENVKKEFEKKMADFAQEMMDVQKKSMTLERNVKEAEKIITATQEVLLLNSSKTFSDVEKRYEKLRSDIDAKLLNVEKDTKLLKSGIEDERTARKNFEEELFLNSSKSFSDMEKRYKKLKNDLDTKLLNVDKDTRLLKSDIEEERIYRRNSEEELLRNTSKSFSDMEKRYKKLKNDLDKKLLNIDKDTKLLKSEIEEEKIDRKNSEERMHVVENQIKLFLPLIEAEKKTGEQLEINISAIEARMNFIENEIKNFQLITEEEKRNREQLEVTISTVDAKMHIAENEINHFKSIIEAEKRTRPQIRLFQNVSRNNSETENQFEELKDYFDSQLLILRNETIDLKSYIEKEKELTTKFQEKIHKRIPKKFESVENQYKVLKEDFEEELLTMKEEINTLKSDIDRERKVGNSFQEEMLLNTSKMFSEVEKQYKNLKNDFDTKLLNVIEDTKLLKSDVEEEKTSRKNSSEENNKRYWNIMSNMEMKNVEFQITISEVEQRLSNVENEVENFTASIKAEKEAREELEVKLRANFSTTSSQLTNEEHSEIRKNLTSIERELSNLYHIISLKNTSFNKLQRKVKDILGKMPLLESDIAEEKAAREDLEIKIRKLHPRGSYI